MLKQSRTGTAFPVTYTKSQRNVLEAHIKKYFGTCEWVIYENRFPDIQLDVQVIPPAPERNWITLVTVGAGAYPMHVPEELAGKDLDRAELMICLPPDWKRDPEDPDYWPVFLLEQLARMPITQDIYIGWGNTVKKSVPFAEDTQLCGVTFVHPGAYDEGAEVCRLPGGKCINFYQVLPLYEEETRLVTKYNADTLLNRMVGTVSHVMSTYRRNVCSEENEMMDWQGWHCGSIVKKGLPVDMLTGYNHMAIYLRWCIEHNLMCRQFCTDFAEAVASVKAHDGKVDLRVLLRDDLSGQFFRYLFNNEGLAFSQYYYDHSHGEGEPCYPSDVDDYALHYFGEERYHSPEFQDEAYLFVPYDEDYYQGMKKYIDAQYSSWKAKEAYDA